RAGEVGALRLGQLHVLAHTEAVGADADDVLKAFHVAPLLGDEVARIREDRVVHRLGGTAGYLGQSARHVGVADVDGRDHGDGAAQLLEGVGERVHQTFGVGVAV